VKRAAELLRLAPYLERLPLSLSGGQQQRTALARAIVKNASLVLLDEPLANLDYKLREELREELPKIFAASGAIFVYATTEASEALLLGGNTATLHQGRITQFGPTVDVYRRPADLTTAVTFSDPPFNTIGTRKSGKEFHLRGGAKLPAPPAFKDLPDGEYTLGFRAHHHRIGKLRPSRSRRCIVGTACAWRPPDRCRHGTRSVSGHWASACFCREWRGRRASRNCNALRGTWQGST
jgi:glycerol transport system ATP-binding protein